MRKVISYLCVSIILLALAGLNFYLPILILNGKIDCRGYCDFPSNCADQSTLMTTDFFYCLSFCLFWVGLGLPIGAIFERPLKFQKIFN
jgi:hypothetical protein